MSTMKGKTLLKGHALVHEGHPSAYYPERGHWRSPREGERRVAHCECGAAAPEGLSIKASQRWHRQHKDSLR